MGQKYNVDRWCIGPHDGQYCWKNYWQGGSRIVAVFKLWECRRRYPGFAARLELH